LQRVKVKSIRPGYKAIVSNLIKIAIVVFAFYFIYTKLTASQDLKDFVTLLKRISSTEITAVLSLVIILMLVNWGLESLKWKRLVTPIEKISLWQSIESVFCGLTWAVFTPNRLGEYGGRVFFLSPKRRIIGAVAMAVGNIGQMVLTNLFGSIALCIFIFRFKTLDSLFMLFLCIIAFIFCAFLIVFYFNIKWLNGILLSMRFTRKYKKFYTILGRYRKAELFRILMFCFARYLVFSTQYFIMFLWLIPSLHFEDVLMMVSILFFVQSNLPSLDLFDIGIRSVTALFFFNFITNQSASVVACTASIWLINIIIPAILGSYFVFKLNFFGNPKPN
jgi:hypothetical protein